MSVGQQPGEDLEYEYEYDETETETFYVNIDLTSHNGPIRPRRRRAAPVTFPASEPPSSPSQATLDPPVDFADVTHSRLDDPVDPRDDMEKRIQIMELHSSNPLVSYRNHIFSCEWADMIGTDMHFTKPEDQPDPSYLKTTDGYSLIAANRIKIVGRKTHLISASDPQDKIGAAEGELDATNIAGKNAQTRFLQELMDIKRARGETDMLQLVFSAKRGKQFEEKLAAWASTEERLDTLYRLNRNAIGGDLDAIKELEELYNRIESGANDNGGPANAAVQRDVDNASIG
ncbi:hypothetical protein BGW36DRAFT_284367 [Talaromyces proteolyticus]|uniref:Transcription factor TFIIIC triple barrel domain-containing protein n=1 Tax=Talaromyces proteolyticus TaxID=1131652 RepID=A0AAD4L6B5_9EURO|nr:uncharacterized protein BGW36DRAFT_284367 [Talaromyces proteolyticus]KAH8704734.1 hypothetical protein BGW36DRAFT_284367 [Talaromyces proteolyticus]